MQAPDIRAAGGLVALAKPRHELELAVRLLPHDESAKGIRCRVGQLPDDMGCDGNRLRAMPRSDGAARRQPKDPALFNQLTVKQMIDNCGSCHARREELTGKFHAGEKFSDHYRLSLPDQAGLYYPDGQVKEEDYEFGSFTMSRMGNKGVTCLDCHNPHSGKLRSAGGEQRALHELPCASRPARGDPGGYCHA